MKDKRHFNLPANKLINKAKANIAELLEFHIVSSEDNSVHKYLVNISKVQKVMPCPKIVNHTKNTRVIGSTIVQNKIIPIIDLNFCLNRGVSGINEAQKDLIVLSFMGGSYGVVVETVARIHYISWSDIKSGERHSSEVVGLTQIEDTVYGLLDLEKIIIETFSIESKISDDIGDELRGLKFALIDDSQVILKSISSIFEQKKLKIQTFSSALDFLASQQQQFLKYDALIVDIEMPGMNGLVLTSKLKSDIRYRSSKIFLYSSLDDDSLRKQAIDVGADEYIVKNDVGKLLNSIQQRYFSEDRENFSVDKIA